MSHKVAMLTAGGIAPCLSSAVGFLIEHYTALDPSIELICYRGGYRGLLLGEKMVIDADMRANAGALQLSGGSPIGNSRVKMSNVADCIQRGLVPEGAVPMEVAAKQLEKDGVTILHTIGGDDTNTAAAELSAYLQENNYKLTVVGLPKTIDNDVYPIQQTLGAWTAAENGAKFFTNIVNEVSASHRMLMIHEVMGRHCGWLAAATAEAYRRSLQELPEIKGLNLNHQQKDIHAVFLPELELDIEKEAARLKKVLDEQGGVNIFLSEGAGIDSIVAQMEAAGETVGRDAFGHVKIDTINPGQWFAKQFASIIGADKILVQKSGYFCRSGAANQADQELIKKSVGVAVAAAMAGTSGVAGLDEDRGGELRPIEFPRIKGGKPFDVKLPWFQDLLRDIGQIEA